VGHRFDISSSTWHKLAPMWSPDTSSAVTGKMTGELQARCCRPVNTLADPQDIPFGMCD
jgi:hypothetical protein